MLRPLRLLASVMLWPLLYTGGAGGSAVAEDQPPQPFALPEARADQPLFLSGEASGRFWARAAELPALTLNGVPEAADRATRVHALRVGGWLVLGLDALEPDGLVAREGVHGGEPWFEDAFAIGLTGAHALQVMVNPFGATWCQLDGKTGLAPLVDGTVKTAARCGHGRWRAEIAVNVSSLGAGQERIKLRVRRQRQQRGLVAYEEPATPELALGSADAWRGAAEVRIETALPQVFSARATLAAAKRDAEPAGAAEWSALPAQALREESGFAPVDPAFQPTEVRAVMAGNTLCLHVTCHEAYLDSLSEAGQELWREDSLELFIGPELWPYIQFSGGPQGRFTASQGKTGGRHVRGAAVPEGVTYAAEKSEHAWTAMLRLPLDALRAALGLPNGLDPAVYPWRIQIVRNRPEREALGQTAQRALLALTHSATSHCPLRFGLLRIVEGTVPPHAPEAAAELPAPVLDREARAQLKATGLVEAWASRRRDRFAAERDAQLELALKDADAWNAYAATLRERLCASLFPATAGKPPERTPLNAQVVYEHAHDGFRCIGVIFESRPGLPVPGTLFAPPQAHAAGAPRPALILIPAHHTPRNAPDLFVMGATIARAGGYALALESIGSGERAVSARWEHKTYQRCMAGAQLALAGEELAGWIAWDISRGVDLLLERGDVDSKRIGILGGVAGGGDLAAVAGVFDERFDVTIPFNFSAHKPMGGYYDPPRTLVGSHTAGLTPCLIDALVAPRRLIQAQEFDWNEACQSSHAFLKRVYGALGAEANLTFMHGGANTHATHFAALHRMPLYRALQGWWGLELPKDEAAEFKPKLNAAELECFQSPKGRAHLNALREAGRLREPHAYAKDLAGAYARTQAPDELRARLAALLGETEPLAPDAAGVKAFDRGLWRGAKVEGYWLPAEAAEVYAQPPGLALWLFRPAAGPAPHPAVLGFAPAGKARLLRERAGEVERLLAAGVAVALLDVRGCGESSPGPERDPEGAPATLATVLWMQRDSLPLRQLKDVRTALAFLAAREGLDPQRFALWGDGLVEPQAAPSAVLRFSETGFRACSPEPVVRAEPAGGWLALAAGLHAFPDAAGTARRVKAVLARGTLFAFASALDERHTYLPLDAQIPGLLRVGDSGDFAAALKAWNVRVHAEDLRDACNRAVSPDRLRAAWGAAAPDAYAPAPTEHAIAALIEALR